MGAGSRRTAVKPTRATLLAAVLAIAAVALAGCGASLGKGDPSSPDTITLYNAQHEQTTNALIKAFTAKTGIHVRVKSDDESVLTAQIEQEGNRSPADVFFTENSNWLQQLDDRGMLSKVDASTLAHVPAAESATNGDWVGVSKRFSVLIYNPSKISVSQLPKTVMQMASPRYKGKLELAPGETDFWPIIQSIVHAKGQAAALSWLKGIKANAGSDDNAPDNETLVSDVSKGLSDMGLINHYYYYRLRAELGASSVHAKLAQFAPGDPGSVQDVSGAGILESSKHQADAQKFLAFLTSPAGQRVLAHSESFEYPLAAGVAPNPALPPASSFHPNPITPAQIGTGLEARNLLRQSGLI
jgi:iron(III) transport system substrate-binding protein